MLGSSFVIRFSYLLQSAYKAGICNINMTAGTSMPYRYFMRRKVFFMRIPLLKEKGGGTHKESQRRVDRSGVSIGSQFLGNSNPAVRGNFQVFFICMSRLHWEGVVEAMERG